MMDRICKKAKVRRFTVHALRHYAASVLDDTPWMERQMSLIREAIEKEIPLLGICFGHQLIARAVAGKGRGIPGDPPGDIHMCTVNGDSGPSDWAPDTGFGLVSGSGPVLVSTDPSAGSRIPRSS